MEGEEMGSIVRRLEALEGRIGPAEETDPVDRERQRAAFYERLEAAWEKADAEATEGLPQRRRALEQLIESMKRRASTRGQG
jgi:hypothetical protein